MGTSGHDDVGAGSALIRTPDQRVRIFISSTLGELAAERRAARASVEQLRLTPIMFELGARPHPPRALYRSYLAQSDVFVGIYWQRYGWVAPDMDISGLEDELQLADGMPRLIYVKRPAPDMEPRLADMLRRLEGDDGPSYKPFTDAVELTELLVDDLALLLAERFERSDRTPEPDRRTNLPAPTSSFVGRGRELDEIGRLLGDGSVRLITLAGPGGTGKTRLAVEAARAHGGRFTDGVCFVGLAAEREPDDALEAIARTLEIEAGHGDEPMERLARDLRPRRMLLVLDNLEQVISAGPRFVELLERCPLLTILATSREVLHVVAEHVVPVPVLSLPDAAASTSIDALSASEAAELFLDRATAVGAAYTPHDDDAADIAAICRHLDGLPLAIELAAARVTMFSVHELRVALESRREVLASGGADRPSRQRTLRDAIEWSEDLLSDEERTVFRLLSVFAGARLIDIDQTLREVPAANGIDVVETLGGLVDKNLVRVSPDGARRPRFSMLQTIREYADEQLHASPEQLASARRAHAAHYTSVAVDLQRRLTSADRAGVLRTLGEELENLRAAWRSCVDDRDVARLDDLLGPLWGYHESRGEYRAAMVLGEDLLSALAALPETNARRHDELAVRAILARTQLIVNGFGPSADAAIVEALDRFDASPDDRQRFATLRSLASLQLWRSDFTSGAATSRELMNIAEDSRDASLLLEAHLMSCISTSWVHDVPAAIEDADRAIAYFEAATSGYVEFRIGPNPGVVANAVAGLLRWMAGAPDAATANMDRALDLADELGHPYSHAFALHHAALLDLWRADLASATARAEASSQLARTHGYAIWQALAMIIRGASQASARADEDGTSEMEDGFARYQDLTTPPIFWPSLLVVRAGAHCAAGHVTQGLELIEAAWTNVDDGHPATADIAIAHGDLLLADPARDLTLAASFFERAAALSSRRGARMTELQALTRLATIRRSRPDEDRARQRLSTVYEQFSEGFASAPVLAAAAVLANGRS